MAPIEWSIRVYFFYHLARSIIENKCLEGYITFTESALTSGIKEGIKAIHFVQISNAKQNSAFT
jgi:hypothetical protein